MSMIATGIFDSGFDAQDAVEALVDSGFSKSNIQMSHDTAAHADHDKAKESGLSTFFETVLGDRENAEKYASLPSQSNFVLTVYVNSTEESARASEILHRKGALNIVERII